MIQYGYENELHFVSQKNIFSTVPVLMDEQLLRIEDVLTKKRSHAK